MMQSKRPNIRAFLDFDQATLFGQEGAERITYSDHISALEEMLDCLGPPDNEGTEGWLKTCEGWSIAAYEPETVSRGDIDQWADWHAEHLREAFGEYYGDEDGEDRLSDEDIKELGRRTLELAEWYVSRVKVWRLEQLRTFTFDKDDVLEMVRELRPEWLNKERGNNV